MMRMLLLNVLQQQLFNIYSVTLLALIMIKQHVCVTGKSGCIHPACTAAGLLQGLKRSTGNDLRVVNDETVSAWTH